MWFNKDVEASQTLRTLIDFKSDFDGSSHFKSPRIRPKVQVSSNGRTPAAVAVSPPALVKYSEAATRVLSVLDSVLITFVFSFLSQKTIYGNAASYLDEGDQF